MENIAQICYKADGLLKKRDLGGVAGKMAKQEKLQSAAPSEINTECG